jgi:hypothetical protein
MRGCDGVGQPLRPVPILTMWAEQTKVLGVFVRGIPTLTGFSPGLADAGSGLYFRTSVVPSALLKVTSHMSLLLKVCFFYAADHQLHFFL